MNTLPSERSVGELFSELSHETTTLIRQELELAKAEMSEKASQAAKDIGFLTVGSAVLYAALLALCTAAIAGLSALMPVGWAALIVALVVGGIGAALVVKGRNDLKNATLSPEKTKTTLKETRQWAKEQMS